MNETFLQNNYQDSAVFWLINKHFWKSKIGPILSMTLPLFFMVTYLIISGSDKSMFASGVASYFSLSVLPLCLIALPQMIVELKNSILLRKISVSKITPFKFCAIVIFYYIGLIIISNILILILYALFLNVDAPKFFQVINWGNFYYSIIIVYISSLAMGLMLGVLIKKNTFAPISGFLIMFISISFSGQFIPLFVLAKSEAMRYLTLFSPLSYSLNLLNNAVISTNHEEILKAISSGQFNIVSTDQSTIELFNNYNYNGIFDFKNPFIVFNYTIIPNTSGVSQLPINIKIEPVVIYKQWQNILDVIIPYPLTIMFIFISIKKFNWTSR